MANNKTKKSQHPFINILLLITIGLLTIVVFKIAMKSNQDTRSSAASNYSNCRCLTATGGWTMQCYYQQSSNWGYWVNIGKCPRVAKGTYNQCRTNTSRTSVWCEKIGR